MEPSAKQFTAAGKPQISQAVMSSTSIKHRNISDDMDKMCSQLLKRRLYQVYLGQRTVRNTIFV
jgi:hypothetical protein